MSCIKTNLIESAHFNHKFSFNFPLFFLSQYSLRLKSKITVLRVVSFLMSVCVFKTAISFKSTILIIALLISMLTPSQLPVDTVIHLVPSFLLSPSSFYPLLLNPLVMPKSHPQHLSFVFPPFFLVSVFAHFVDQLQTLFSNVSLIHLPANITWKERTKSSKTPKVISLIL